MRQRAHLGDGQLVDFHDRLILTRKKPDFMMGIEASRRIWHAATLDVLLAARQHAQRRGVVDARIEARLGFADFGTDV